MHRLKNADAPNDAEIKLQKQRGTDPAELGSPGRAWRVHEANIWNQLVVKQWRPTIHALPVVVT